MSQPIRPAEIQMELVSQGTGMRRTTAPPGAQMQLDPTANPMLSNQGFRQIQHAEQNSAVRAQDANQQYLTAGTRAQDQAVLADASAQEKARALKEGAVKQILDSANTPALDMLFSGNGMAEMVTRDAMQQQAIAEQLSPDLADYSGQLMA